MLNLQDYGAGSGSDDDGPSEEPSEAPPPLHLAPLPKGESIAKTLQICAAPAVIPIVSNHLKYTIFTNLYEITPRVHF